MRQIPGKLIGGILWAAVLFALALIDAAPGVCAQGEMEAKSFTGQSFRYRVERTEERPEYRVVRLVYPSPVETAVPQNGTIPAELYLPRDAAPGGARRPAVICLHILDGNVELVRLTCAVLAGRGIPALWFPLPYYGERGLPEGRRALSANPRLFVEALSQSMLDVRRTVDVLATRPEVDPERIGVMGFSLGGIVAATAAAQEPRLHRAMLALAGGDLPGTIARAREMGRVRDLMQSLPEAEREALERAVAQADPLTHAEGLRGRALAGRVLMVNAEQDEVIPREATEKLAAALGIGERVEWLDGLGHYTAVAALPRILQRAVDYFAEDLPAGVPAHLPAGTERAPAGVVRFLLEQVVALLGPEPGEGKCHIAECEVSATPRNGKSLEGRLLLIRGHQGRFRLECMLPKLGRYTVGQSDYPWMSSDGGALLRGSRNAPVEPGDPLTYLDPELRMRGRVLLGGIAGLAMAPDAMAPLVTLAEEPAGEGGRALRITSGAKRAGSARLRLKADGITPDTLSADTGDLRAEVRFRRWQMNAPTPAGAFDPPQVVNPVETDAASLYRSFAGLLQLAAGQVPMRLP